MQERIIDRYKQPVWILSYPDSTFRNLVVEPGDFIAYSWEEQKDSDGYAVVNQIGRVLKVDRDLDALTINFTIIDYNSWLTEDPYLWDGTHDYGEGYYGYSRDRRDL